MTNFPTLNYIKVLSIDGGGVRGIIPALLLAQIEQRTGQPIANLFHLIVGTSVGGILALALTAPGADGQPRYTAAAVIDLFDREILSIFLGSRRLLRRTFTSKYSAGTVETVLERSFGEGRLQEALCPVMITAYDIERCDPHFFKSRRAARDGDLPLRDVARATSAAPTIFTPYELQPTTPGAGHGALIDGGVFANNPAMCAYAEVSKHRADYAPSATPDTPILLVSLGTGHPRRAYPYKEVRDWGLLRWARATVDIFFEGMQDTVDYQLRHLLPAGGYYRFQPQLAEENSALDDASPENIAALKQAAQTLIAAENATLTRLCAQLTAV